MVFLAAVPFLLASQTDWPLTRAEKTNFLETSTYAEVINFMKEVDAKSNNVSLQTIGKTYEGRDIIIAIVGEKGISTPAQAKAANKLIVHIQANIHAGEVEGKESSLRFLRGLAQGKYPELLKNLVFVINPIYNADGNEKFGPQAQNRPGQNGPELVGVRTNSQGFDLNRDCMKAESPEMRAVLSGINQVWDPDVVYDLHTTNGTRHGYELTYSPSLHPNTPKGILDYSRDELMPQVRAELARKFNLLTFDYGNAVGQGESQHWETFGWEGRYVTNYAGISGRVSVLSEATVYWPFKDRVIATDRFVEATLNHIAKNKERIQTWRKNPEVPKEMGVRFQMVKGRREPVRLEKLAPNETKPAGPPTSITNVEMDVWDRFAITKTAKVPLAYFIPESESQAAHLAARHGLEVTRVQKPLNARVETYFIDTINVATRAFQGHFNMTITNGAFREETTTLQNGYLVKFKPIQAALAFNLLEPESLDGVVTWNVLTGLSEDIDYPIRKILQWK